MAGVADINTRMSDTLTSVRQRNRSRFLRPILMVGGLLLLVFGAGVWWLNSGRIVSIDDAYVRAAKVSVSTDVSGIVAVVAVHEGQVVRRGDILLRLDDRPFRIAVDGARAERAQTALTMESMKRDYQRLLHEAQAAEAQVQADQENYNRFAGLVHSGAATRAETDDARFKLAADQQRVEGLHVQAQVQLAKLSGDPSIDVNQTPSVQQAQAKLDEAERQLEHSVVRAPFDGVVTQVESVQPGMFLGAATPAFALVSSDDVWAEGNPKETELTWVKPGNSVTMRVDTYPGRVWNGVVESISPASGSEFAMLPAQNTSGNWVKVVQRIPLRVHIEPKAGDPPLRAGMSVVLAIDTGHIRKLADLVP